MKPVAKSFAYALLRIAIGLNFAGHGLIRIYNGVGTFASSTAEHLVRTPLPHILVLGYASMIPFIELILGIALVLGTFTRVTLGVASLFIMTLTLGVTANQQWDVAGQQLLYSLVLFVLLFLHEHNDISLDNAL